VTRDVRVPVSFPLHQSTDAANAFDGRVRRAVPLFQWHLTLLEGRTGAYMMTRHSSLYIRLVHDATPRCMGGTDGGIITAYYRALNSQRAIPRVATPTSHSQSRVYNRKF